MVSREFHKLHSGAAEDWVFKFGQESLRRFSIIWTYNKKHEHDRYQLVPMSLLNSGQADSFRWLFDCSILTLLHCHYLVEFHRSLQIWQFLIQNYCFQLIDFIRAFAVCSDKNQVRACSLLGNLVCILVSCVRDMGITNPWCSHNMILPSPFKQYSPLLVNMFSWTLLYIYSSIHGSYHFILHVFMK